MSKPIFISYGDFVNAEMLENFTRYKEIGEPLPSRKSFYDDYVRYKGFGEWIESIRSVTVTENQAFSIASTFVNVGKRKVSDLVSVFVSLERHQKISLPVQHKILTAEYWERRLKNLSLA
jgi:hypothetical protein